MEYPAIRHQSKENRPSEARCFWKSRRRFYSWRATGKQSFDQWQEFLAVHSPERKGAQNGDIFRLREIRLV
jgi:hypothetical protein